MAADSPDEPMGATESSPGSDTRRLLPGSLIALATLVAFVSVFSTWIRVRALDTDTWVELSDELLAKPEVQQALSTYLVDELYAELDVSAELEAQLPDDYKGLAGPISGALRGPATSGAERLIASELFRTTWLNVNRTAHQTLVNILRDETGPGVSTADGAVTLDLGELLVVVGERLGLSTAFLDRLPEDAGQITVFESDELTAARTAVAVLDFMNWFLIVVVVVLYAAAVYLAPDRRLEVLRNVGLSLIGVGVVALIVRVIAVRLLVDALVADPGSFSWANVAAYAVTGAIRQIAWAGITYGLLVAVFATLLGERRWAVAARRLLAPAMNASAERVAGGTAVLLLLVYLWSPGNAFEGRVTALILVALIIGAIVALRRRTMEEFPDVTIDDLSRDARSQLRSAGQQVRPGPTAERGMAEQLESLHALHTSGALADDEYARAKAKVLAG